MGFAADIPQFYCLLRAEYAYDLQSHHGEFIPVLVFAVDSVSGRAIGFDVLTDFGAMFARLPISALVHKEEAPKLPLDHLELWNNFSYCVEAHEYGAIRSLRCEVLLKDRKWYPGVYMFTLSWYGDPYAEDPGEGGFKRAHIVKLDNRCFTAQPNNRMRWYEASFITKPFPQKADFKTNSHVWNCENGTKWATENSDRYFYELTEAQKHEECSVGCEDCAKGVLHVRKGFDGSSS